MTLIADIKIVIRKISGCMQQERWLPAGWWSASPLLALLVVLGALPVLPMLVVVSPTNVCVAAAAAAVVPLLAKALDSRRVMPMPPVLLGEWATYLWLPPPMMPTAPLPPGVALVALYILS